MCKLLIDDIWRVRTRIFSEGFVVGELRASVLMDSKVFATGFLLAEEKVWNGCDGWEDEEEEKGDLGEKGRELGDCVAPCLGLNDRPPGVGKALGEKEEFRFLLGEWGECGFCCR